MDAKFIKISGLLKVISCRLFDFRKVLSCNRVILGEGKYREAGTGEGSDCFGDFALNSSLGSGGLKFKRQRIKGYSAYQTLKHSYASTALWLYLRENSARAPGLGSAYMSSFYAFIMLFYFWCGPIRSSPTPLKNIFPCFGDFLSKRLYLCFYLKFIDFVCFSI